MSFTSKNLQSKKGGLGFIKGATLFFLGMSCVLFVTKAFNIEPVMNDAKAYFKTLIFTASGSNVGPENITLDGTSGDATFAGTVTGTTLCLAGDDCITNRPTGAGGGDSVWSTGSTGVAYYNLGNVGIGTTIPGYKLDVNGHIRANGSLLVTGGFGGGMYRGTSNVGGNYPYMNFMYGALYLLGGSGAGGHPIYIGPNAADGTKGMVMTTGGYLGIGTTDPLATLDASGTIRGHELLITDEALTTAGLGVSATKPTLSLNHASNGFSIINFGTTLRFQSALSPMIFYTNANERMRIDTGGKVGIGTNTPGYALDVNGTGGFDAVCINGTCKNAWPTTLPSGANTQVQFNNAGSFGASPNLVWNNTFGRLGIGTATSPVAKLQIDDVGGSMKFAPGDWSSEISITNNAVASITGLRVGQFLAMGFINSADGDLNITTKTNATQMYLKTDGNVGIGTSSPAETLEVNGGVRVTNAGLSGYGDWYIFQSDGVGHGTPSGLPRCPCDADTTVVDCPMYVVYTGINGCYDENSDAYEFERIVSNPIGGSPKTSVCSNVGTIVYAQDHFWGCKPHVFGFNYWLKLDNLDNSGN